MRVKAFCLIALGIAGFAHAGGGDLKIKLDRKLQVPGGTLSPGTYSFALEDRLPDRAIVKITNQASGEYNYVLAIPDKDLEPAAGPLILFPLSEAKEQVLQGWKCPDCASSLRFVYPKDEAVALTQKTAKSVLAVDPSYDKLPSNLSADDRKVITLWLLSPKEITSDHKGKGVEAAKYVSSSPAAAVQTASAQRHMPHTASNTFTFGLIGLCLFLAGSGLKLRRYLVSE